MAAAVSCSEVMYGAYYPYLYGRGAARSFHPAPHFQYTDRLNVQSGAGNGGSDGGYGGGGGGGGGALSSGSASSGAGSPPGVQHHNARLRAKEEEVVSRHSADAAGASSESEGECGGGGGGGGGGRDLSCAAGRGERARAQYVSANCVVFTHYSGDVAAVVDEHFARALAIDKPKESVPMVSRNLPASFFNAALCGGAGGGGGGCGGGGGGGGGVEVYEYDPWQAHYAGSHYAPQYAAHAHAHAHAQAQAHQHMAAAAGGYGGLLLGRGALHAQYKPVEWGAHASHHHAAAAAHLDPAAVCSPYYPPVPGRPLYQTGLEAQVQDTSKDLYWF